MVELRVQLVALVFVEAAGTAGEHCGYRAGAEGCRGRSRREKAEVEHPTAVRQESCESAAGKRKFGTNVSFW